MPIYCQHHDDNDGWLRLELDQNRSEIEIYGCRLRSKRVLILRFNRFNMRSKISMAKSTCSILYRLKKVNHKNLSKNFFYYYLNNVVVHIWLFHDTFLDCFHRAGFRHLKKYPRMLSVQFRFSITFHILSCRVFLTGEG